MTASAPSEPVSPVTPTTIATGTTIAHVTASGASVRVTCSRLESLRKEVDGLAGSLPDAGDAGIGRAEIGSRIQAWRGRARELEMRIHRFAAKSEADWLVFERRVNRELDGLDSDLEDLQTETNRGRLGLSRVTTVWPGDDVSVFIEDVRSMVQ